MKFLYIIKHSLIKRLHLFLSGQNLFNNNIIMSEHLMSINVIAHIIDQTSLISTLSFDDGKLIND